MRQDEVPSLTVQVLRDSATLFPTRTGLGWDKMHPRAIGARCPDFAMRLLVAILVACERLGRWPRNIGVVLICLIPKPDGGRRPIGLLLFHTQIGRAHV